MVTENVNPSLFRNWIKDAPPEELLTIAPAFFSRLGTLEPSHQDRFIQEVQRDPQAKRLFEKMPSFNQ